MVINILGYIINGFPALRRWRFMFSAAKAPTSCIDDGPRTDTNLGLPNHRYSVESTVSLSPLVEDEDSMSFPFYGAWFLQTSEVHYEGDNRRPYLLGRLLGYHHRTRCRWRCLGS